ncbi:Lysine-specific demethylase no66 [Thalictrum thalictroides]|uniref:Bifunctional lysine-specific demethylase and histidyl-hydroxylase n=1 Tax=Thalictrum thalictroides TaxID=46969 RepID=A0A7J6VPH6_THATH|nr:Lysine-specific demethylase no66 [Thalictrum thalictroides]
MFNFWEKSPFLLKKPLGSANNERDILSSVLWSPSSGRIHDVLSSILRSLVSCPPLPSDEVDILNFLKEAKDGLGQPITYGQDIRVIKAVEGNGTDQGYPKSEVHFQQQWASCRSGPDLINIGDVQKCEEAYEKGYTIALRGMEFRSDNIASVANGLAVLFGQPSVGANAYLTPPGSQGLARHYDDHCVFVCQLLGQKQWSVYPRSTLHLPRLYEPRDNSLGSEVEVSDIKSEMFLLGEGDILYIPRGCLHEACTKADDGGSGKHDASTGFSLHLTLGIEVESPFEWEGLAHVALHSWNQNNKQPQDTVVSLFPRTIDMSVHLLHVAIQQIGSVDPSFAKACMVVTFSSPSEARAKYGDALSQSQRDTFRYVISKIDREVRFLETFKNVEVAVREKKEDMFQRMRWIRHLYPENSMKEGFDWDNPFSEFHKIYLFFDEHREYAENVFMQIKSRFCREVMFEDACKSFGILLEKYKRVRTQYMNGMLNLHSNGNI